MLTVWTAGEEERVSWRSLKQRYAANSSAQSRPRTWHSANNKTRISDGRTEIQSTNTKVLRVQVHCCRTRVIHFRSVPTAARADSAGMLSRRVSANSRPRYALARRGGSVDWRQLVPYRHTSSTQVRLSEVILQATLAVLHIGSAAEMYNTLFPRMKASP